MNIFTPKGFLSVGGIILVVIGILGFFLIGPTEDTSIFGAGWWFDGAENWAHLVLGIVALVVAYAMKDAGTQKNVTAIVGIIALLVGIYGFISPSFLGANLEILDNFLHLIVGIWALVAAFKKGQSAPMGMGGGMPATV